MLSKKENLQKNNYYKLLENKLGFIFCELIEANDKQFKIGIIDADLLDQGTKHPNLALLKISGYCKEFRHSVKLICDYSEIADKLKEDIYDFLIMSKVFNFTKIPAVIQKRIDNKEIIIGGTGFYGMDSPDLPDKIEHHMPDYELYTDFISSQTDNFTKNVIRYEDYLNYSIGFTTRGCFRKCSYCVNRKYDRVIKHSPISEFLDPKRRGIYLWDDNFMASPDFYTILDALIATGKPFQFRQGLDIRLMTADKAERLAKVKYKGDFIFAFDHIEDAEKISNSLKIWKKYYKKSTKLYVLTGYDSQDERDIENTFERIKIIMEHGCLPYIMRYEDYKESKYKSMYIQLARWCNQPNFLKKKSFRQYCKANEEYHLTHTNIIKGYCSCYKAMIDFEMEFPEIAKKYYDLRFEEINQYKSK
ncbi:MAG TPA: hypothetical protein PLK90_02930 [Clostridiales bacterium]|nr:hypothetical protein [Clostridiales bacterium]HQP69333.1 hypothetical protein [Clostridiales bacterium]